MTVPKPSIGLKSHPVGRDLCTGPPSTSNIRGGSDRDECFSEVERCEGVLEYERRSHEPTFNEKLLLLHSLSTTLHINVVWTVLSLKTTTTTQAGEIPPDYRTGLSCVYTQSPRTANLRSRR